MFTTSCVPLPRKAVLTAFLPRGLALIAVLALLGCTETDSARNSGAHGQHATESGGAGVAASGGPGAPATGGATVAAAWGFESDAVGAPPAGFQFARTGPGRPGRWEVRAVPDAAEGTHVLVQLDPDATDDRFPLAIADAPVLADLRLSVRGRPLSGEVDQVFGLVFRCTDRNNYYLTRANILEDNVRLYHVVGGKRKQIGSWKGPVTPGPWHTLSVDARGDHFTVSYDGAVVIDLHDATLPGPGRIGLWTKADSVTQFDGLRVEPLQP